MKRTERWLFNHQNKHRALALTCVTLVSTWLSSPVHAATEAQSSSQKPMNILMIAVDDLNHWVGNLNRNQQVKTPNIDALASKGMSFQRAYAPAAICNATRSAMMTGLRPSTSGVYSNGRDWRSVVGPHRSLPAFFKANGYKTLGGGKIFHKDSVARLEEWDYYYFQNKHPETFSLSTEEQAEVDARGPEKNNRYKIGKLPISELAGGDDVLNDYHVARWASAELSKTHEQPFFMSVGIFRPHLPWAVPKKYFEMYPEQSIELPPYKEDDLADLPKGKNKPAVEHTMILKEGGWKRAIRAYLASVTYADAQVGRVLEALENGPNKDNTMIVLWGDHGWHLGEKHRWRKFALWEEATRTPYIWVVPGVTTPNSATETPVDLQSIWQTMANISGLDAPNYVEGENLIPLLENANASWHTPALTTQGYKNHAVRYKQLRLIQYANGTEEFYDHSVDPYEWENLAGQPAKLAPYAADIAKMRNYLPTHNREWNEASKLYGGDPAYAKFKKTKMVDTND
ncbi:sulfatase [Echinimonas agarilytica]|uniref:Sulfatase n=1 Tax=Echinimonas agarilytica TaxID=1215918 RepID=A0AA41W655_9GAMM|nr:sulfatase [Echinimonas agarilytica]MCM2679505.1 sulfatase [Echinimonas agarilytica]